LDQIDYLKTQAYAIFAIVPSMGPLCEALRERGVQFEILRNPWWTKAAFAGTPRERAATLAAARVMAGLFLRWEIDLVYTQTIVAPAGALAAAMAGKPHVWHIHEFSHNPECIEMALPRPALAHLLNLTSNLIIFNSHAVASEWLRRGPKTALTLAFLAHFNAKDLDELIEGVYLQRYRLAPELALLVFAAASQGDPEAI